MDLFFNVDAMAAWLSQYGVWAIGISLLVNVVISILGVIPSLFLSGANAVVFGMVPGFFVSLAGETIGAGISFVLYRWGVRHAVALHTDKWKWLQSLNHTSRKKQISILLFARFTPLVPSGVITFAAAISNMIFLDFIIVSLIGKAPSIAMETLVGHDLIFINENWPRLLISILFFLLIYLIFRKNNKSTQKEKL